jgi:hypothetical protein
MAKTKLQPDPFDVYYFAVCYNKSVARLEEQPQQHPYGIAQVVLQTLSLEVFLKCVHRLRGNDIPPVHNLKDLFGTLAPGDQKTLSDMFAAIAKARHGNPKNLALLDVLDRSKRLFEAIRYAYEEEHPGMPSDADTVPANEGLNDAILAIRDFIKSEKPDYGPRAEHLHTM